MHREGRDSFLATLESHQLLEPRQLRELLGDATTEPIEELARRLVLRGWLTAWQVEQLKSGEVAQLVLGQYALLEPLGQGGMGVVYKARHRRLERIDALKLIRKEHLSSETAVQRFYQEAKAAARLHHPNIVSIYDADEVNGTHYMAMEYVAGVDLAHLVKKQGRLRVGQACDYVRQAALGLQHAHEKGLVHRDIKPSNLIVTAPAHKADGQPEVEVVKVLDMGLARLDQHSGLSSDRPMTNPGGLMGTPDYMAPEQATDAHGVDIRADLYSLGCTLYHLLAGRVPFPGGSLLKKLDAHRSLQPKPLSNFLPQLLPEVERIVFRLLAKQPADRYQTPGELAIALGQLLLPDEADEAQPTTANLEGMVPPGVEAVGEATGAVSAPATPQSDSDPKTRNDDKPGGTVADESPARQPTKHSSASSWADRQPTAPTIPTDRRLPSAESAATISIRPARPRPTEPSDFQLPPDPAAPPAAAYSGSTTPRGSTSPPTVPTPVRRRHRFAATVVVLVGFAAVVGAVAWLPLFDDVAPRTQPTASVVTGPRDTEKNTPVTGTTKPPTQPETKPKATSKTPTIPEWQPGPLSLTLPGDFVCGQAALSANGRWLLIAEDVKKDATSAAVYRFAVGPTATDQRAGMEARGPIDSLAISTEGSALLGSKNMLFRPVPTVLGLWSLANNLAPSFVTIETPALTAVAFGAQGEQVLSGDSQGIVQIWSRERDVLRRGPLWPQSHQKQEVRQLAFTPDGELAISAGRDKVICVWNVKEGKVVTRFTGHEQGFVTALAVSPVKPYLVLSGDYYGGLHLWHPLDWKPEQDTQLHPPNSKAAVRAAAFDSQGLRCVSGGDDRQVTCWDVAERKRLETLTEHKARILSLAFVGDGSTVLSAGDDKVLYRHRWPAIKP